MTLRVYFTPASRYATFLVNYEGAALDASDLFAVHILFYHHVKYRAQLLVSVGYQGYSQVVLGAEILVLAVAIARYAEKSYVMRGEGLSKVAKFFIFNGAAWSIVSGVKVQNPDLT